MRIQEWMMMIVLVAMLSLGSTSTILVGTEFMNPLISYKEEKSALTVENQINDIDGMLYGRDLFMSLFLTEGSTPYPKSIKINNTPIIDLDNDFIVNKYVRMGQIYDQNGQWKFSMLLDKRLTSVKFVSDSTNGDYIQYILQ